MDAGMPKERGAGVIQIGALESEYQFTVGRKELWREIVIENHTQFPLVPTYIIQASPQACPYAPLPPELNTDITIYSMWDIHQIYLCHMCNVNKVEDLPSILTMITSMSKEKIQEVVEVERRRRARTMMHNLP